MVTTNIRRIIKSAFVSFWRNAWVSVATILVMVLALFMIGSLFFFQALLNSTLAEVEKKVDVSVYFKTDSSEEDIFKVRDALTALPEVKSIEYISRDEALRIFKERHGDNALIASALEELGDNPLNAALKIRASDPSKYEAIALFLEGGDFKTIDKVNYRQNQQIFDRLARVLTVSRRVGAGVSIALAAIAFLVAFNTIRLAIYTARDEIGIMRVVGASNWFVRGPFLVEGAIHGFFATLVTVILFWPATLWVGPRAKLFFGGLDIFEYYAGNFFSIFFTILLIGITLGVFSSFVATRRYLKI